MSSQTKLYPHPTTCPRFDDFWQSANFALKARQLDPLNEAEAKRLYEQLIRMTRIEQLKEIKRAINDCRSAA